MSSPVSSISMARKSYKPGALHFDLTILRHVRIHGDGTRIFLCRCKCGNKLEVRQSSISSERTKSCGCRKSKDVKLRFTKHGKHGIPEYNAWKALRSRCRNSDNYAGRGIKVCKRWSGENGFQKFLKDMGLRPSSKHSIDRIDNDGDYRPSNCQWATRKQQNKNRRNSINIPFQGKVLTLMELSARTGVGYTTLKWRYENGYTGKSLIRKSKKT